MPMTDSRHYVGGWKALEGENAYLRLGADIMTAKLSEAGAEVDPDDIFSILSGIRSRTIATGRMAFALAGMRDDRVSFFHRPADGQGQSGILHAEVAGGWRISAEVLNDAGGVQIVTSKTGMPHQRSGTVNMSDYLGNAQDLPHGGAAQVLVLSEKLGKARNLAFVAIETHFSDGKKWNPAAGQPAETGYYPDGVVKWRRSWVQGRPGSHGDAPIFESFWTNGRPQTVEYGGVWEGAEGGKHRDRAKGPAYVEFFHNGKPALAMFAERGKQVGPLVFFGADGAERKPTDKELEAARNGLVAGKLSSPMEWLVASTFLDRHESCIQSHPELMKRTTRGGPKVGEGEGEAVGGRGGGVVALPRPGFLGRLFDKGRGKQGGGMTRDGKTA